MVALRRETEVSDGSSFLPCAVVSFDLYSVRFPVISACKDKSVSVQSPRDFSPKVYQPGSFKHFDHYPKQEKHSTLQPARTSGMKFHEITYLT